jgi:hypothetical protein
MTLFKIFHANGALNALNIGAFVQVYKYYKSFTNSVEICLILITKFAKIIQFWRNILQNMYDFGEISLTCIFFLNGKIMTDNDR